MRNFPQTRNLIACYEDDEDTQDVAADILNGRGIAKGTLPVTVTPELTSGIGLRIDPLPVAGNSSGSGTGDLFATVDSIAEAAIRARAIPGCVVLAAGRGRILYHRSFGYYTYDSTEAVRPESVFDMASVTKICATTLSVMKLYDRGQLSLSDRLGDFLPWVRGSDKESLRIRDILLHQAGLKAWIPFFRETIDTITGIPFAGYYSRQADSLHTIPVADTMFMKTSWRDTLYKRIVQSPLEKKGVYVYSDNDFIFLGKIVEAISGMPLDSFVQKEFYRPMGLTSTGFNPRSRITGERLVPTEQEKIFRRQLIRGYVHDPGAAMFGGVSGHAGLFSQALDIAAIMHMLMNGGLYNGKRFLSDSTVRLFTAYGSPVSRRGLGFDKPEKDNATRKEPYPSASASYLTFGHTGFTGTCAWADPKTGLVFVFLSNRVYPDAGTAFLRMNVRGNVQEAFYQVLRKVRAGW
jgi:CubicO group peptidase (beta-lactamase class C family)